MVIDPAKARIRGKKNSPYDHQIFTEFYAAHITRQPRGLKDKTIGYVVHAHCWSLFGKVEGLGLANVNLAKLVRVCRKYWRHHRWWWALDADYTGSYEDELNLPYNWEPCLLNVSQSPLTVPGIQQAMDSAAKTGCNDLSSSLNILPLELMILISDYVCPITDYTADDVRNLRNMLLGFRWQLPKYFWRVRLDESLFSRLSKCDESSFADWKLRLSLMSIVADPNKLKSSGLVNRGRVLEIMRALKEAYMK